MEKRVDKISRTLAIILLFSAVVMNADVFTLAPYSGGKAWGADILGGQGLWSEPIVINGIKTSLSLKVLTIPFDDCLRILKQKVPKALFKVNGESILIEIKRNNGRHERVYIVKTDGVYSAIQFSMELPLKMPKKPEWPSELPISPASKPITVISLPERDLLYGTYTSTMSPGRILNDAEATMTSKGWKPLGRGVFLKEKPMRIIMINVSEDEDRISHVFVMKKNLDSGK